MANAKPALNIDQLSFLLGGCGALGAALYSGNLYRTVPDLDLNPTRPPAISSRSSLSQRRSFRRRSELEMTDFKRKLRVIAKSCLVKLKALERFFIGGCAYTLLNSWLEEKNIPILVRAFLCGGAVGMAECLTERGETILKVGGMSTAMSLGVETLLYMMQRSGKVFQRPIYTFFYDEFDPMLFVLGAWGSSAIAIFTFSLVDDIYFPLVPNDLLNYRETFSFLWNCLSKSIALELRAEECTFLGGSIAWGIQGLMRKIGMTNRFVVSALVGLGVSSYFTVFGKASRRNGMMCVAGFTVISMLAELMVAPSSRGHYWQFISKVAADETPGIDTPEPITTNRPSPNATVSNRNNTKLKK